MRKSVFGGVAMAAAFALFGATGVAASEPVDNSTLGGQTEVETGAAGAGADLDQLPGRVLLEVIKAEQAEAEAEAQAEKPADEVVSSAPKAREPEQETENEIETESNDGIKVAATPEPTESPEQHDGGSDSGSDN
jgi:hypothetical protein